MYFLRYYKRRINKWLKSEAERRDLVSEVKKGSDVTELKFRTSIHGEDMHYPGEMISGCKLMEKCIDCCHRAQQHQRWRRRRTVRTHTGKYPQSLFICWTQLRSSCWLEEAGQADRELYGYEMYKTSEYDHRDQTVRKCSTNLYLAVKGDATFVVDES